MFFLSLVFSSLFALAITYASLELIRFINTWMLGVVPDCVLLSDFPRCQEIESVLQIPGYVSLAIVFAVIVAGFILDKTKLTLLGTLLLYLPTIGYFAFTMFFLAGVGVLRFLWYPFINSEILFRLGLITYSPLWLINSVLSGIASVIAPGTSWDFSTVICFIFMFVGLFIFILGMTIFLYDRLTHKPLSTGGLYKFTRHPQYLGFIIWSYGFLSLASVVEGGRGWSPPAPGLPWLITVTVILSVALIEEIKLRNEVGGEYIHYVEHTPFIILMPRILRRVITYPARILIGKEMPTTREEVLAVACAYLTLVMLVSLCISYLVA